MVEMVHQSLTREHGLLKMAELPLVELEEDEQTGTGTSLMMMKL